MQLLKQIETSLGLRDPLRHANYVYCKLGQMRSIHYGDRQQYNQFGDKLPKAVMRCERCNLDYVPALIEQTDFFGITDLDIVQCRDININTSIFSDISQLDFFEKLHS